MTQVHDAPGDADLSPARRERDLVDIESGTDVIVVGGGITGAGIALDAASRGLRVTLLERVDLGFGTSRWSSKLVHGGLRYLASGDVTVAWESARERATLMRTVAPFLIRPMAQVIPIMRGDAPHEAALTRLGLVAGDLLRLGAGTRRATLPGARTITRARTARLLPALDTTRLRGGLLWWDGSLEDDARLTIAVARTAAAFGARILTGFDVVGIHGDRVLARSSNDGSTLEICAPHIVNATGVWAANIEPSIDITVSRGTHVVLRSSSVGTPRAAMTIPHERGRYCFVLPRPDGLVLAGITDEAHVGPIPEVPDVPADDLNWILDQVSGALRQPLTEDEVVGAFTGLRPLAGSATRATADLSRKHRIQQTSDGVWTIIGGKLTTYRRMAEDMVDHLTDRPCRTQHLPVIGAGPLTSASKLPVRLIRRYGSEAPRLAALADDKPELLRPIAPGIPVLGVELIFGVVAEGARSVSDLVERRTRIDLVRDDLIAARPIAERIVAEYS